MESILFKKVDSRSELQELLRRGQRSVLLGDNEEATKEFFIGLVAGGSIGVCSQGCGIEPSSVIIEKNGEAWIGYNATIANVDIRSCRVRFERALDCVFYSITAPMQDGSVIVIYELGACRVNRSGELLWNCSTDVVIDFSDDGDALRLRTDQKEIRIDKERGKIL